ncbi:MAG: hypothetical protein H7175_28335 [Burkholderiales bacterium]|nr:hypothetical protein [Anaerolineae bacterium]
MSTATPTVQFIRPHTGQEAILRHPARFRVVACGRRFGKTETGKILLTEQALRGARCWWLAPTFQMSGQVWRDLKALVLGTITNVTVSETEKRMDFPGGGMMAIRSTHVAQNLRGMGLDFAVLDEAAFMEPTVWPEVVRPMLLERRGGALFLSSPNGLNWFHDLYQLGLDPMQDEWRSFQFTSYDNPLIAPDEIDNLRRNTPERVWREEYMAEFIADSGQVFRNVRAAASILSSGAQPVYGRQYIAGLDWGKENDSTVIVIIDAETRQMVDMDRFNQIGWELQRGHVATMCAKWQPSMVWAEANSIGAPNIEALQAEGLPVQAFTTTARSKQSIIEGLALAIERGEIGLLADDVLLGELAAYTLRRLPGGGYQYGAPSGLHDDCVIALALAWHGVRHGGARISFA